MSDSSVDLRPQRRLRCGPSFVRCYGPSLFGVLLGGVVIAYGTFVMQGCDLARIQLRHYVNGVLLWLIVAPVLTGFLRAAARSVFHPGRPA